MYVTPSSPSFTHLERVRTARVPRRTVRPAAAIGTILFGIVLVVLLAWLGRYAMPPVENLFQGGR